MTALELNEVLSVALKAICLTRDYVGKESLPAIDGWEWYEAGKRIALAIPEDEWVTQFALRVGHCPQCKSKVGLKYPRGLPVYCEDCGWPECDYGNESS